MIPWLLPHPVEQAVARYPERPALRDGDREWNYRQLWSESGALAAGLQTLGLVPGGRVGIWLKKSAAAAHAILATLRAGGAYVPLDPFAPAARIANLIRDCGLEILIADARLASAEELRRPGFPLRHLVLAEESCGPPLAWQNLPRGEAAPRPVAGVGADLAYVLYTSGSTGQPKGVMHCHRHALNFIAWAADEVELRPADRVASVAPFHFDLSIFDLFATWSRGACLCLLDAVTARFPSAMAAWLDQERITVCYAVPSAWVRLLPCCDPRSGGARLEALRTFIFAGEVFPASPLRAWVARLPAANFYNWYGPTETNVCAAYRLPAAPAPVPEPLPIGLACPNFELRLGDEEGRPVAHDAIGYLWARGELFLGYWGDEARMAAVRRRLPGPALLPSEWYNTGDLARCDAAGVWYFEGRRDDLVKVRGYRVSLLEVQQTLLRAPEVRGAAVMLVGAGAGEGDLHAYVVSSAGELADAAALRAWCAHSLPHYMVPAIHFVSKLPETATGKLDRPRLLQLARGGTAA